MRLHLETLSLKDMLTDICELFTAAAEQRGLELELLITGDATVLVDRQRVQQAVSNLLDNALAYTPSGTITVLLDVEPDSATIHVLDTGPGISPTDPQRIWRRFMRGSAASASAPGIGLGLSLVKAVAHVHRGEAGVQNRPEGGADFWIKLPTGLNGDATPSPVPALLP
jgi:signal transduction histidine kinase